MNVTLVDACLALFFLVAPGLLAARAIWPHALPRWGVLVGVGALSGTLFYLRELFHRIEMTEWAQRIDAFHHAVPAIGEGMVQVQGPRFVDFFLGVVLGLVYLLLWLVPYGVTKIVWARFKNSVRLST